MTLRSKLCKFIKPEEKSKIKISDLSILMVYVMVGALILFVFNFTTTVGLLLPMVIFNYEPVFILGSIETFPILYSLTSYTYGILGFIFGIIPLFTIAYLIFLKIIAPIATKIGSIKLISCDLKDD